MLPFVRTTKDRRFAANMSREKPGSVVMIQGTGSSVGKMCGKFQDMDFLTRKRRLWSIVADALDTLRQRYDIVVVEGTGSPAEINLRSGDIVNMVIAHHANSPVFLVGDIDKGGVFASLYGTVELVAEAECDRLAGYLRDCLDMNLLYRAMGIS